MEKYCVAYMNFYDNDLKQIVVECSDIVGALCKGVCQITEQVESGFENCDTIDDATELAFDSDSLVSVIKLGEEYVI